MARPRRTGPPKLLTDVELELMNVLWTLDGGTVRDVLGRLPAERNLAYTTVSTVLRVLEEKCLVKSAKDGRAHVYRPAISKEEYERRSVRDLTEKVFDHQPTALVRCLLDSEELSSDQLEELRSLLERKLR